MDQTSAARISSTLDYTEATKGWAPIPAAERLLPTAIAEPFFKVADEPLALEGPAFDREGHLWFVDIYGGRVLSLSPDGKLSTRFSDDKLRPAGIAIHRDGRIFAAGIGDLQAGSIIALNPDGSGRVDIVPASAGYVPDDLVFDRHGGIYFTDFRGSSTQALGGVYYVPPTGGPALPVLTGICAANGVGLSPDGQVMWATEFCTSRLHRVELEDATTPARTRSTVPYHFVGRAPDSLRVDANGNAYVAMYNQGRILVFSPYGVPIGQILLPGRDENRFLKSTSLALMQGSRDLFIVSRDDVGDGGSMIFRAQGLAPSAPLFSHQ